MYVRVIKYNELYKIKDSYNTIVVVPENKRFYKLLTYKSEIGPIKICL